MQNQLTGLSSRAGAGTLSTLERERHAYWLASDGNTDAALAKIDLSTAGSVQTVLSRLGNRRVVVGRGARVPGWCPSSDVW
jgi:hypothetical protein